MADEAQVDLGTVKRLLSTEGARRELSYEQRLALQHAESFSPLTDGAHAELLKKVQAIDERISPAVCLKIIEVLPRSSEEVRALFTKERYSLETATVEKILALVEDTLP